MSALGHRRTWIFRPVSARSVRVGCVKGTLCGLLLLLSPAAWAGDELASGKMADGTSVPYVLTTGGGTPAYVQARRIASIG